MVYVVERYLPGLTRSNLLGTLADLERATEELREGPAVRYLGSTIVIGDEACFCQFEASSQAAVAEANRTAGLSFDRIVPVVTVSPTQFNQGRSQMNASTTVPVRIRMRRRWPFVAVAALLAAGCTVAVLAISTGSNTTENATPSGAAASSVKGPSATSTAQERQYVKAISSIDAGADRRRLRHRRCGRHRLERQGAPVRQGDQLDDPGADLRRLWQRSGCPEAQPEGEAVCRGDRFPLSGAARSRLRHRAIADPSGSGPGPTRA